MRNSIRHFFWRQRDLADASASVEDQLSSVRPYRVLLPVINRAEAELLLPLAEVLTQAFQGELVLLQITSPKPETGPDETAMARDVTEAEDLEQFLATRLPNTYCIRQAADTGEVLWSRIWHIVEEEKIDLLLVGWRNTSLPETAIRDLLHPRLATPPCDLVFVRPGPEFNVQSPWAHVRRILVPMRNSPHAVLAVRVADALAEVSQASLTFLHVIEPSGRRAGRREDPMMNFAPAIRNLARLDRSIATVGEVGHTILEESSNHQAVILGAPTYQTGEDGWSSPLIHLITSQFQGTVIVVKVRQIEQKHRQPESEDTATASWQERPITLVVNKWFAENTFHSRDFEKLEELVRLKEEQNLTISLGLPALNEEETVGNVIKTVKHALMEQVPLLDEMVLIDSGSVDYTREIAADLGIPVYIHQDILPQYGSFQGKGEALWKSLAVLKGDLIAWIDTDIVNIHPRFVYGVLGPLLSKPHIQYVKGFYRRPLKSGDKLVAGGGGRVTELTARPLINLFFPELSGLVQPLAGEYAGRRTALEQLPFFTGYGVETGLLIDILETFGLHSIAQIDLKERIHHNQSLHALSKMSFAIIQVVVQRLEQRFDVELLEEINKTMNLIRYQPNRYYLEAVQIREHERPPMISIPEYREQREKAGYVLDPAAKS
jgi:glucosyl-3-phosphoglycerate synthase